MGRHTTAEELFRVEVIGRDGQAVRLRIEEDDSKRDWAQAAHIAYLLRTSCTETDPVQLWKWCSQLTELEDAFRISKSDMGLRPVFHKRQDWVQAHILICFLALAMWRTWSDGSACGDGVTARRVIELVTTVRSMDAVLPVQDCPEIRLKIAGEPDLHPLIRQELRGRTTSSASPPGSGPADPTQDDRKCSAEERDSSNLFAKT
jgi:hypothetical protein